MVQHFITFKMIETGLVVLTWDLRVCSSGLKFDSLWYQFGWANLASSKKND
jgi:hypothetical protein